MFPSGRGTIYITFITSNVLRELDAVGEKLIREITIPDDPESTYHTQIGAVAEAGEFDVVGVG